MVICLILFSWTIYLPYRSTNVRCSLAICGFPVLEMNRHYLHNMQSSTSEEVEPRRLELILNPVDGSLQTVPLLNVIMSATDVLYTDIYNMAHGELEVTSAQPVPGADDEEEDQQQQDIAPNSATRRDKMASLSFAQRRHELGWRLASHSRTLTHVAALTAANATTNMANATRISTHALQHARTAWVQADEAQDALYFFHARLFPARAGPHDVYGALDTMLAGAWPDLPQDLKLTVDPYEKSNEKAWSSAEVSDRWQMAVRDKLIRGEMGWMKQNQVKVPWKISLRGGIVRLTHGQPKTIASGNTTKITYPIEAILTVLSTDHPAQWTLVHVEVHAQAKTGQSNHQLDTTFRQRFDLLRLCAQAMHKEERRVLAENMEQERADIDGILDETQEDTSVPKLIARPLHSLFQVAHVFGLSWQLEILSAQAQSIRRGAWGTKSSSILVTPVQFFENRSILGIVSISFWSVDDRYGPPLMADLHLEKNSMSSDANDIDGNPSGDSVSTVSRSINTPSVTNQLTLSIRAEPHLGIRVALSGAENVMEFAAAQPHVRSTIRALLEATSNPFTLSASEALLAATRLCAERKCYAMADVLPAFLPHWITLRVERGSIVVAARIGYHTESSSGNVSSPVVLFRMSCDARTGSFASTFARSTALLRYLACNDPEAASDSVATRMAEYAQGRQTGRSGNAGVAAALASGRAVRDAFEGLSRSMNVLGQRTGVGGGWKDIDSKSASLRRRAVELACRDVRVSLVSCCGMAALYGLSALSLNAATGVAPQADMAGGTITKIDGCDFLPTPPLSILVDQNMVETTSRTPDGEKVTETHTEQELFGVFCSANDSGVTLYGATILARLASPTAIPVRTNVLLTTFTSSSPSIDSDEKDAIPPSKRARTDDCPSTMVDLMDEVERFALVISKTFEL
jgi:hypothetical protein